jgi:hypothetical protein
MTAKQRQVVHVHAMMVYGAGGEYIYNSTHFEPHH